MDTPLGTQKTKCLSLVDAADLPLDASILGCKFDFKWKDPIGDCPARARVRCCICGNQQRLEKEDNTFAPVARMTTMRLLFSYAIQMNLDCEVSDISTAFPNALLPSHMKVFMKVPKEAKIYYKDIDLSGKYFAVNRALYGLASSPRAFNQHLHTWLQSIGFLQSKVDPCLYFRMGLFIIVYVDDIAMIGESKLISKFKKELDVDYTIRHHGPISVFCGMEFSRDRKARTGKISMLKYSEKLAKEFLPSGYRAVKSPSTEQDSFTQRMVE